MSVTSILVFFNLCVAVGFLLETMSIVKNFLLLKKAKSSHRRCSLKKGVLRNFVVKRCFSCEFCKISKNTFSYRTPQVAASEKLI